MGTRGGMHSANYNDRHYGLIFGKTSQPYKGYAQYLSKELENHDPEVSLAVRVQGSSSASLSDEDEEDVDEFLSSLGFEFVDARSNTPAGNHDGANALVDGKSI